MSTLAPLSTGDLLRELGAIKDRFHDLYGISLLGLVGSRARGDHGVLSDIDIAVKRQRRIGLMTVVRAKDWLEKHFGTSVDLVFLDALPNYKKSMFLEDFREIS
jgi:predicted nucleotidyltransferase